MKTPFRPPGDSLKSEKFRPSKTDDEIQDRLANAVSAPWNQKLNGWYRPLYLPNISGSESSASN
jgi:hypothetical protein